MYTAVLRSVCSYKFLEISLFRKKSIDSEMAVALRYYISATISLPRAAIPVPFWALVIRIWG
ncbi:MAG: hypothetical protein LBJ16_01145 [Holosporaceae bacterium]|nr:hypothetical protein [Holosporaceae bacterium]